MTTTSQPTLTLDTMVSLHEAPSNATPARQGDRVGIAGYRLGRRGILTAVAVLGTTAGLSALGIFPKAKEAAAACIGNLENTISGGCPLEVGNCTPACGPSMVYSDVCNADGWHRWTGNYRNRPDDCNDNAEADGWRWAANCECPSGCVRSFRCHDGCKLISGAWRNSICRVRGQVCACP